jgi:predicted Abi (CAAX) family protease
VERGSIIDPRFKFDVQQDSNMGNIRISPTDDIDDQIKAWILLSRKYADGAGT